MPLSVRLVELARAVLDRLVESYGVVDLELGQTRGLLGGEADSVHLLRGQPDSRYVGCFFEVDDDFVQPELQRRRGNVVEVDPSEDEGRELAVGVCASVRGLTREEARAKVFRRVRPVRIFTLPAFQPVVVGELGLVVEGFQVVARVVERGEVLRLLRLRHLREGTPDRRIAHWYIFSMSSGEL